MSQRSTVKGTARRRWPWQLASGAVLLVAGWLAVCHAVLDSPRVDPLERSDAVFVLGPPDEPRVEHAMELVLDRHVADTLVIAKPEAQPRDPQYMVDYYTSRSFCQPRPDVEVICFEPNPSTTQGEAMKLRELARERHWDTVTAVTFDQHVPRARMILERCYSGDLRMSPVDYQLKGWSLVRQYIYQTAGFLKAALTPGCDQQLPWHPKTLD